MASILGSRHGSLAAPTERFVRFVRFVTETSVRDSELLRRIDDGRYATWDTTRPGLLSTSNAPHA